MPLPAIAIVGAQIAGSLAGAALQNRANRKLAQQQNTANQQYLQQQLDYNTPNNQMARFQEAGLNPHLVYSQGNAGNQASPLSFPEVRSADFRTLMQAIPLLNQSRLVDSQVNALDAKTRQTTALTELNRLQAKVLERNPLLDDPTFRATLDSIRSAAELKAAEAGMATQRNEALHMYMDGQYGVPVGYEKVFREVELLEQKFKLGQSDQALKAEVLKSKEFQNAILEVQKRFMTDAEITPQHFFMLLQTLLMKAL